MEGQIGDDGVEPQRGGAEALEKPRARSGLEGEGGALMPLRAGAEDAVGRGLLLPTGGELELMLNRSEDGDSLADLEKAAATLVDVAKRQDLVKEQLFEIAEWHLRVKRKLGAILVQTDSRGGDRAKSQAATLLNGGLPPGVNKSSATRCRQLARVVGEDWEVYLSHSHSVGRMPSAGGMLRFAESRRRPSVAKPKSQKQAQSASRNVEVGAQVLAAICRCLGDIDVCVGEADVRCRSRVDGESLTAADMHGVVLVACVIDPEVWLSEIAKLNRSAQCQHAVVFVRVESSFSWFQQFSDAGWSLCFVDVVGGAVAVAYLGGRCREFVEAMSCFGLVVSVQR